MSWRQAVVKNIFDGLCFKNMHCSQLGFMQNRKQRTENTGVGLPLVEEHQTTTVNSLHSWFLKCEHHQGVLCTLGKVKAKVLPITGHEGPEGEYRYSSTLSWPRRLDGGGWSAPRPGRFTPGKDLVPIV